jgi:hypothetical protein
MMGDGVLPVLLIWNGPVFPEQVGKALYTVGRLAQRDFHSIEAQTGIFAKLVVG